MELRLEELIGALRTSSGIDNLSNDTPVILHHTNPLTLKTVTIVCSVDEPVNLVLPLNVNWFNFDPTSQYYLKALKRSSKDAAGDYDNTWDLVDTYDPIWEDQFYDADDTDAIGSGSASGPASTTTAGLVRLSAEPQNPGTPVVVVEGDPRLTDARPPTAHSHAEIPATVLQHASGTVTISGGTPADKSVLVADGPTSATWRQLEQSDILA